MNGNRETGGSQLDILFLPFVGVGHMNACIGIAQILMESGHRVTFAVGQQYRGRLAGYGIRELLLPSDGADENRDVDPDCLLAEIFFKLGNVFCDLSPLEKISGRAGGMRARVEYYIKLDRTVEALLTVERPDVIFMDQLLPIPAVELSGIPYVWSWSTNPLLMVDDERTPPSGSGLSAGGDPVEWAPFRAVRDRTFRDAWVRFNEYVTSRGCGPLAPGKFAFRPRCLTIYGYPHELDYTDQRPLPDSYVRFDNLKRTVPGEHGQFELPSSLADKPGKVIYFSLGSMGAVDVPNMRRLVGILGKSPNRFIVSKGPKHLDYDLPGNMWGRQSVPQLQVLPAVDLVITHGGNNTVTESLYYGRPMIVMPLFGDQYDNAQRIHERGFGVRLDAYKCSEVELLEAVEGLLADREVATRLESVSRRIQADNSIGKLPAILREFVKNQATFLKG